MGTGRVVDAKRVAESPLSPAGFRPLLWSFVSERGAARRRVLRPAAPVKGPPLLHLKERDPSDSDGGQARTLDNLAYCGTPSPTKQGGRVTGRLGVQSKVGTESGLLAHQRTKLGHWGYRLGV